MGYPFGPGVVTTTGIVGRRMPGQLLADVRVGPGDSGGPMLASNGDVVGITTYLAAPSSAGALAGAISPSVALEAIRAAESHLSEPPPQPDSLPVLPTDTFPLEALERALAAEDWPTKVYDISKESVGVGVDVRVFTPPLLARLAGEDPQDLRYWALASGEYPPVVIVRIEPKVDQSARSFFGNLLLGTIAGATGTFYRPFYELEAKGRLGAITLQGPNGRLSPIQIKKGGAVRAGQPIQVAHVLLSPDLFRPGKDGTWQSLLISVYDSEQGPLPWVIPARTMEQVYHDFQEYLALK